MGRTDLPSIRFAVSFAGRSGDISSKTKTQELTRRPYELVRGAVYCAR